jgi:hypothetical protein
MGEKVICQNIEIIRQKLDSGERTLIQFDILKGEDEHIRFFMDSKEFFNQFAKK